MKVAWPTKPLADVCKIKPPKAEARNSCAESDLVSFVPMEDLGIDQKVLLPTKVKLLADVAGSYTYFADGDVLMAKITPCFENGKLGIAANLTNGIGFGSSEYIVFRPSESLNREWLYYFLSRDAFKVEAAERMSGAVGHKRVPKEFIETYPIPVPRLPEQHRIVGILDEAFDGLARATANAEQNLRNARALFESHLDSVFTQRGEGWVEKRLEEVLAMQPRNGWSPPAANHADSGTPVLTLSSVTGFVFRPEKIKFTSAVTDSRARYWVQNGDLLITRSNTPELVGHVAIASGIEEPTIYPDLIMRMNPNPAEAITEFLYYQMRTPALRSEVSDRAQGANPTMKKISNGAVRTLPIFVPPIHEQRRVVVQLDALAAETQRLESIYQQKLAALSELKKSLLHEAFTGQL
jgi:type I restriction enzyme S subunit